MALIWRGIYFGCHAPYILTSSCICIFELPVELAILSYELIIYFLGVVMGIIIFILAVPHLLSSRMSVIEMYPPTLNIKFDPNGIIGRTTNLV